MARLVQTLLLWKNIPGAAVCFLLLWNSLPAQPQQSEIPLEKRVPMHILQNRDMVQGGIRDLGEKDNAQAKRRRDIYLEIELELEDEPVKDVEAAKKVEEKKSEYTPLEVGYELDLYYSNVYTIFNLTSEPVPEAGEKGELAVYRDLFLSSYLPRFLLLEVSVNPMPIGGVALRENAPDFYNKGDIGNENAYQILTAGFEEPYAVSFFLGNMIQFSRIGREVQEGNRGFMGYLVSYGSHHIVANTLVRDDWLELEWKIKGDRDFPNHVLSWSFRLGAKLHRNPEITDVMYVALRRSFTDFTTKGWSFFRNTGFQYRMDFDYTNLQAIRHYLTVDKKFPFKWGKSQKPNMAFSLALGFIWEANAKYSGSLREIRGDLPNWQIVVRPNIEF